MEKAMVFKSMTAEVKFLIMEYMNEKKDAVDRCELVQYVKENAGGDERLTDGVIAGALKILLANGELVTVRRGCYQLGDGKNVEGGKNSAFDRIYAICNKFKADLDRACTVNLLSFSDEKKARYEMMAEELKGLRDTVEVYTERLFENIVLWNEMDTVEKMADGENQQVPDGEGTEEPQQTALLVVEQPEGNIVGAGESQSDAPEGESRTETPAVENQTDVPAEETRQEEAPEMHEDEKKSADGKGKSARKKGGRAKADDPAAQES